MAGRRPKPTELKRLQGNPGKRKLNNSEPQPTKARPRRPKFLTKDARRYWTFYVAEIERLGILTVVDGDALASFCQCLALRDRAVADIEKYGAVLEEPVVIKGQVVGFVLKKNPACNIAKEMMQQARAFGSLFGLSPSDRSRIKVETPDDNDPLKEFERRRQQMMDAHEHALVCPRPNPSR
jgi:P27 family predicted phage terminase small subunit